MLLTLARRVLQRIAVVGLLSLPLAGCLTSETLVRLNADRSGTVEQTILLNVKTLEALPELVGGMFGQDGKGSVTVSKSPPFDDMFDETKLRADASRFGPGVRFVSAAKQTRGGLQGATLTYAFDDVNALLVDRDPPAGAVAPGLRTQADDALGFALSTLPNGNTLLTIQFDEPKPGASSTPSVGKGGGTPPPGMEAMVRQMFDGFRVAIDVEVNGAIVRTSSPHVNGSRVTVLEMDLGALLADENASKVLERLPPGAGVAELAPLLADVPAIKLNGSPLTIEFAAR